jgi:hypothetical protein
VRKGKEGGFAMGAVFILVTLVGVLVFAEWRRRGHSYQKHRFKLVEYRAINGQPSQFDFVDL